MSKKSINSSSGKKKVFKKDSSHIVKRKKDLKNKKDSYKNQTKIKSKKALIITNKKLGKKNSSSKKSLPLSTKEETLNYYKTIENKYFDCYGSDILNNLLFKEKEFKLKKAIITEEILTAFNLTKDLRKYALNYLFAAITNNKSKGNIDSQSYFITASIFDLFLINYYNENNSIDNNICRSFFISKITNQFSEIKLILFLFCCFYLANHLTNTKKFDLRDLTKISENYELTYEELNELTEDILICTDGEINTLTVHHFINIFMFDIISRFKVLYNNNTFIENFQNNVLFFSCKIIQDLSCMQILPSIQALGIILLAFEYTKYKMGCKYGILDVYIEKWTKYIKEILEDYNDEDYQKIIKWMTLYIKTHNM